MKFTSWGIFLVLGTFLVTQLNTGVSAQDVNGGWSDWSVFDTPCSKSCGGGNRTQSRSCTNPVPQGNGKKCLFLNNSTTGDLETRSAACNTISCYAGMFSNWTLCDNCTIGVSYAISMCGNDTCPPDSHDYVKNETSCNRWNKTVCPSPCLTAVCPEYGVCQDTSTETEPSTKCTCTMGYIMNQDKTGCIRPPPTTPTPRPIPTLPPAQKTVATVISKSASTILIVFVSITLIIFFLLRIFTPDRVIQMNMEIAILTAHCFLMFPPSITEIPMLCKLVSILLHFFYTACYIFMMLEALHMYFLVAYVVKKDGAFTRMQNTLLGWGLSLFIVLFCICFHYDEYGSSYQCWIQMDQPIVYGMFVPVIIIVIITFTLIEAAGAGKYKPLTGVDKKQRFSAQVSQRTNLIILPFVLADWLVGIFSEYEQNLALYSVFSILNGVTGFLIFFFHCTNNQQVREKLKSLYKTMCNSAS